MYRHLLLEEDNSVNGTESAVKKVFLNPFNIQLIEPKDHFFDSEDRAERKHTKRKNATITKFGAPCMEIKPIRQYHQYNEEKILPHKRL
jgi:hypothetical protein